MLKPLKEKPRGLHELATPDLGSNKVNGRSTVELKRVSASIAGSMIQSGVMFLKSQLSVRLSAPGKWHLETG